MKKIICALLHTAMVVTTALLATACLSQPRVVRGNGHEVKGEFDISLDYTSLSVSQGIVVELIPSDKGVGTITADQNIIDYVTIVENGGRVKVSYEPHISIHSRTKTVVKMPLSRDLHKIKASSAARVESPVRLTFEELDIDLSSAATLELDLDARELDIDASSAAKFTGNLSVGKLKGSLSSAALCRVEGRADECEVRASSAAHFEGIELVCRSVKADVSSAASIAITATEEFDAEASSGGMIKYKGSPTRTKQHVSSGGALRNVE